jgi:hypothetical protein
VPERINLLFLSATLTDSCTGTFPQVVHYPLSGYFRLKCQSIRAGITGIASALPLLTGKRSCMNPAAFDPKRYLKALFFTNNFGRK